MTPNTLQAQEVAFTGQEHVGKWYQPGPEQLQNNPQHRLEHEESDVQTFIELGEIAEQGTVAPSEEGLEPEDLLERDTMQAVKELLHSETPESRQTEILESLWQRGGKSALISICFGITFGVGRFKIDEAMEGLQPSPEIKFSDILAKDERDAEILAEVALLDTRLNEELQRSVFEESNYWGGGELAPTSLSFFGSKAGEIVSEAIVLSMSGSELADLLSSANPLDQERVIIINYATHEKDWNDLLAAKLADGIPEADRQQKVEDFINAGHGEVVAETCLEAFPGLDHKTIAFKLIEKGEGSTLINYFEKFEGLSQQEVFKALDASSQVFRLVYNLEKFPELDVTEVALAVVRSGYVFEICTNAEKFSLGDQEAIVDAVLQSGNEYSLRILGSLDAFPDVDQNALVRKLEANFPEWPTDNLKHFSGLEPNVALEIAQRRPLSIPDILGAIDSFTTLNDPDFIDAVIAGGYVVGLVNCIEKISPEDPSFIVSKVLESDQPRALIDSFETLHVDKAKLVSALLREGQLAESGALDILAPFDAQTALEFYKTNPELFLRYVESFELNNTTYLLMVADGLYTGMDTFLIKRSVEKIVGVDPGVLQDIPNTASQAGGAAAYYLVSNRSEFPDITDQQLIELLAANNRINFLLHRGENIVDPKVLAEYLISKGDYETILYNPNMFDFIDEQELYDGLLDNSQFGLIQQNIPRFTSHLTTETIELIAQNSGDLKSLVTTLTSAGIDESTLPRSLTLAIDIGGEVADSELVTTITSILSGKEIQNEDLRLLGVTKIGEAGVEQLKSGLNKFTDKIMTTGEIDISLVRSNPVLQSTLIRLTRFDSSSFGTHDRQNFLALLERVQERSNSGSIETITPSTISVAMLDKEARAEFKVSEDGVSEWHKYAAQIERAKEILREDGSLNMEELNLLLGEVELLVTSRVERTIAGSEIIRQKIADKPALAGKLQPKLEEQLALAESLRQIDQSTLMNFSTFFTHIQTLKQFEEMHEPIGIMMIVAAIGQSGRRPDPVAPTLDELNEMADFIGRVTNEETWGPLFGQMGSKAIDTILSIDALTSNIKRAETITTSGTMPLQLITTNGLLMELSGHIGDACWAGKYGSIAETFPNFSSVIMVQNAGTAHARMAGSSMLIEASSADGEPLLIIRGLNPIQNVITQLSTTEFLDSFIDYVKQMAAQSGRRVAMVIDDHSGGAGTNRPDLHEAMLARSGSMPKATLNPDDLTTFNGYDISRMTYLV